MPRGRRKHADDTASSYFVMLTTSTKLIEACRYGAQQHISHIGMPAMATAVDSGFLCRGIEFSLLFERMILQAQISKHARWGLSRRFLTLL